MKFIIITFLLSLLCFCSCTNPGEVLPNPTANAQESVESTAPIVGTAYVLLDYTEGQNYSNLTLNKIMATVFNKNINMIKIQPIRDLSFNKFVSLNITPPEDHSGSSLMKERKAKKALADNNLKFKSIITDFNILYSGTELNHSAIINPLCDVLHKAGINDHVIIFSDLLENSNGVNFRGKSNGYIVKHFTDLDCSSEKTYVTAVIEAFRPQDDPKMRRALKGWNDYFSTTETLFTYVTNI